LRERIRSGFATSGYFPAPPGIKAHKPAKHAFDLAFVLTAVSPPSKIFQVHVQVFIQVVNNAMDGEARMHSERRHHGRELGEHIFNVLVFLALSTMRYEVVYDKRSYVMFVIAKKTIAVKPTRKEKLEQRWHVERGVLDRVIYNVHRRSRKGQVSVRIARVHGLREQAR